MPEELETLYPPLGLTLRAGDLTLRLLRDADLPEYAVLLRRPIFADEAADHVFPWYAVDPEDRVRGALQFQWTQRAVAAPERWNLTFGIWAQDQLVGTQDVGAKDFPRRRTVTSGSWLTRDAQGKGYGKLMRQMVLALAFDHLGAQRAESEAVLGNDPSFGVSRACGYALNGTRVTVDGNRPLVHQCFLVTPETFVRPQVPVTVEGLVPALRAMLGA